MSPMAEARQLRPRTGCAIRLQPFLPNLTGLMGCIDKLNQTRCFLPIEGSGEHGRSLPIT